MRGIIILSINRRVDFLELERIYGGDDRIEKLNRIYTEAFPPQERFGFDIIMRLADQGILEVFAVMEESRVSGLFVMCVDDLTAYVCYFAIDKGCRGKGLGSSVISQICRFYPEKQTVLEIEALDASAENFSQRKRRESFYLRAGFRHTDRYIRYEGVTYEILFSGKEQFDKAAFEKLMDTRRSKDFQPLLFDAKKYSTYIFDLDGTLLDTLTDLTISTNFAVQSVGCPAHTKEEVCSFVGNGIKKLIHRALPKDISDADFEKAFDNFKTHYKTHCKDNTKPYDGIMDMLRQLKAHGKKVAVVSNKADFATKELCKTEFGELVDISVGEKDGVRRKPAPDSVKAVMQVLGSEPHDCVYIGDSDVDIETAKNAGLDCISVLWGFRSEEFLTEHGAKVFAQSPGEICLLTLIG